jgi:hypothetical protein
MRTMSVVVNKSEQSLSLTEVVNGVIFPCWNWLAINHVCDVFNEYHRKIQPTISVVLSMFACFESEKEKVCSCT